MRRLFTLLVVLAVIALLYDRPKKVLELEPIREVDIQEYADWSVDGVRPGMSMAEAKAACGRAELLSRVDYFGTMYRLYDGRQLDWMHSGHFVVNEDDQVVSAEGYELKHHGKVQENFLAAHRPSAQAIEDRCRHASPMLFAHRYSFRNNPVVVRGEYFSTYILGQEPEWLTFCKRADDLGDCLECLSHLQKVLVGAEKRLAHRPETLEELSEYTGTQIIQDLQCPLGGDYQLSGSTLTCFSHPEGPISLTRSGTDCRFWQGAP